MAREGQGYPCYQRDMMVMMMIYIYTKVNLASIVEDDQKAPFSLATTPRCRGGHFFFLWIFPLFFLLTSHLKGPTDQQITFFSRIIYGVCFECFCAVTHKTPIKLKENEPNR